MDNQSKTNSKFNNRDRRVDTLVNEYLLMESDKAKDVGMLGYMARSMVIATLPHSRPSGNHFQRTNGNFTLLMSGNPSLGLPYGSLPRLILAWITKEAKVKKTPVLELGKNFSTFLKILKLSQSGGIKGDATRLKSQMLKLFSTHISCIHQNNREGFYKAEQFTVTRSFELWWSPIESNKPINLQQSTVTLAQDFFEEIIDRPVPIDFRMLQALRRSPLQMDIYVWLTYRFSYLKKPTLIPWILLINQFGSNYSDTQQGMRDFRREFIKSLRIVTALYPSANIEVAKSGLILKPSLSHISRKVN